MPTAIPLAAKSTLTDLFTSAVLPATGNWVAMTPTAAINLGASRDVIIDVSYTAGGAGGYPQLMPLVSFEPNGTGDAAPSLTADVWRFLPASDGSVSIETIDTTLISGDDFDAGAWFGVMTVAPLILRTPALAALNDDLRMAFHIKINAGKWFQCRFAEKGNTGAPGTFSAKYLTFV